MTYVEVDWSWVNDQLKQVGEFDTAIGHTVKNLLDCLETEEFKVGELGDFDTAMNLTKSLFKGQPVVDDAETEKWLDLRGGDLSVRDTVRIKTDAYTGPSGIKNNGKRGRVTAMRNGKITVLYDGDAVEDAKSHDISALQKLDVN